MTPPMATYSIYSMEVKLTFYVLNTFLHFLFHKEINMLFFLKVSTALLLASSHQDDYPGISEGDGRRSVDCVAFYIKEKKWSKSMNSVCSTLCNDLFTWSLLPSKHLKAPARRQFWQVCYLLKTAG